MLTIVIPSYNHENYITECLDAAREVDVVGRRIIVIDDGSTDGTADIVRKYIEEYNDPAIELVIKKNSGLTSSLNLGLSMTITDYVYFVASDDIPQSSGILQCIDALEKIASCQFCIGGGVNFFDCSTIDDTPVYGKRHRAFFTLPSVRRNQQIFLDYPAPLLLQSVVFRTAALRQIGGWDSNLKWDDYPVFVKLLARFPELGSDFLYKPDVPVVRYRHHGANTYKNLSKQFFMVRQAMDALAPAKIKERAIGNSLAFYSLAALRNRDIKTLLEMARTVSWRARVHILPAAARIIARKVMNRS